MKNKFILLEWNDGWREVIESTNVKEVLRYYVIQRIEETGRLVLDKGEDYPDLMIIERKPRELSRVTLISTGKAYQITLQKSERFGDKVELSGHIEVKDSLEKMKEELTHILAKKGYDPKTLLSLKDDEKMEKLRELGRELNLYPSVNRHDAYAFMLMLLEELARSKD